MHIKKFYPAFENSTFKCTVCFRGLWYAIWSWDVHFVNSPQRTVPCISLNPLAVITIPALPNNSPITVQPFGSTGDITSCLVSINLSHPSQNSKKTNLDLIFLNLLHLLQFASLLNSLYYRNANFIWKRRRSLPRNAGSLTGRNGVSPKLTG